MFTADFPLENYRGERENPMRQLRDDAAVGHTLFYFKTYNNGESLILVNVGV